jgi:uncharacterized membrane protein
MRQKLREKIIHFEHQRVEVITGQPAQEHSSSGTLSRCCKHEVKVGVVLRHICHPLQKGGGDLEILKVRVMRHTNLGS